MTYEKTDIRNGMAIDWDVPITMEDGIVLRADVYRPIKTGRYPVIMSYGPYAKWLQFQQPTYAHLWEKMTTDHPEVATDSSNRYQNWEVVDPEKWVRDGYVCVRIDSRGAGRSPGYLEIWSAREAKDYKICIDWGGVQAWSNGKVGLNGISYFGQNQWQVAGLRPKHLAAMCVWEGASDFYREASHHGGIYCVWLDGWTNNQIWTIQNGLGNRGFKSPMTGDWVSGPENLTDEELGANRLNYAEAALEHELFDDFWKSRHPQFAKIEVPLLSTGNWGGHGLHLRGNTEGFLEAGSKQKWLEIHGDAHWAHFYTDYGRMMQKRFFDYFLKGEKNGWDKRPKVVLQVRHPGEKFVERGEDSWPLARTQWTKMHLDAAGQTLAPTVPDKASQVTYKGLSEGVTFMTPALDAETEITGPLAAKLFVSSSTTDADLFLVVRAFGPDLKEITFHGANEPHAPIAQGWLRASHRKLD
ncbi:MAG: CocE/NonD family hydrolase [Burkholderiales bacterium]